MNYKILYVYIALIISGIILSFFVWVIPHRPNNTYMDFIRNVNIREFNLQYGSKGFLMLQPNSEVIALNIIFRGGSALEPLNKKGITNILIEMLTSSHNDHIKRLLQKYSIKFTAYADIDNISFDILTTRDNVDHMFEILALILSNSQLDPSDLAVAKQEALLNLKLSRYYTFVQGHKELFKKLFNNDPRLFNSMGDVDTLRSVTISDLVNIKKTLFTQSNIAIGVSGNIDRQVLTTKLNKVFSSLPVGKAIPLAINKVQIENNLINVAVPGATNTDILVAFLMPSPLDKALYAANIANSSLGDGFNSLLMDEIRVKRGLAYTAQSSIIHTIYGSFGLISVTTENNKVSETINTIKIVIDKISHKNYHQEELKTIKQYMNNRYLLQFRDSSHTAYTLAYAAFWNKSVGEIYNRNQVINAITTEDVEHIIHKYIEPNKLLIIVAGAKL